MRIGKLPTAQAGFAYLWLLMVMMFLMLGIGQWAEHYAAQQARAKQQERVRIVQAYQQALQAYYVASPGSVPHYPSELEKLLRDPRHLQIRRYLRRLELDPVTGRPFVLQRNTEGGIVGVGLEKYRAR